MFHFPLIDKFYIGKLDLKKKINNNFKNNGGIKPYNQIKKSLKALKDLTKGSILNLKRD